MPTRDGVDWQLVSKSVVMIVASDSQAHPTDSQAHQADPNAHHHDGEGGRRRRRRK